MAAKIVKCRCSLEFWTDTNDTLCPRCRRASQPTTYGLRFYGGVAEPTQAFWRAWRANPDAVKREGFVPRKQESGRWKVKQLELGAKARVRSAIDSRMTARARSAIAMERKIKG